MQRTECAHQLNNIYCRRRDLGGMFLLYRCSVDSLNAVFAVQRMQFWQDWSFDLWGDDTSASCAEMCPSAFVYGLEVCGASWEFTSSWFYNESCFDEAV